MKYTDSIFQLIFTNPPVEEQVNWPSRTERRLLTLLTQWKENSPAFPDQLTADSVDQLILMWARKENPDPFTCDTHLEKLSQWMSSLGTRSTAPLSHPKVPLLLQKPRKFFWTQWSSNTLLCPAHEPTNVSPKSQSTLSDLHLSLVTYVWELQRREGLTKTVFTYCMQTYIADMHSDLRHILKAMQVVRFPQQSSAFQARRLDFSP